MFQFNEYAYNGLYILYTEIIFLSPLFISYNFITLKSTLYPASFS